MKYIIVFLFIICSCKDFEPKEVILSDRNKKWQVEVIEGHEFLWRNIDRSTAYIHRPNCKTCKLNNNVFE